MEDHVGTSYEGLPHCLIQLAGMAQPAARVPGSQLEEGNLAVLEGCAMGQEVAVPADAYIRPEKNLWSPKNRGGAEAGSAAPWIRAWCS